MKQVIMIIIPVQPGYACKILLDGKVLGYGSAPDYRADGSYIAATWYELSDTVIFPAGESDQEEKGIHRLLCYPPLGDVHSIKPDEFMIKSQTPGRFCKTEIDGNCICVPDEIMKVLLEATNKGPVEVGIDFIRLGFFNRLLCWPRKKT